MNPKVTIGFVAALVLVAAVVFGVDRANVGQSSASPTPEPSVTVFQFDDQAVTALEARVAANTVRFEKQGESDWRVSGSGEPANRASLTSILIRLSQLEGTKRVENSSDLASFGLADPATQVTATLQDGTAYTLLIGDRTPTASGSYAKRADSGDVVIIPTQLATDIARLVTAPVEPTPTPVPSPSPATGTPSPTP